MEKMKVLVFGAGAIGTYIGGSLALAGHKVVFVEQPQAVESLLTNGLKLNLALDPRRQHGRGGQPSAAVSRTYPAARMVPGPVRARAAGNL